MSRSITNLKVKGVKKVEKRQRELQGSASFPQVLLRLCTSSIWSIQLIRQSAEYGVCMHEIYNRKIEKKRTIIEIWFCMHEILSPTAVLRRLANKEKNHISQYGIVDTLLVKMKHCKRHKNNKRFSLVWLILCSRCKQ